MTTSSRRDFLLKTGQGLGAAAFAGLLPGGGLLSSAYASELADPLAPKQPHIPAKVKTVQARRLRRRSGVGGHEIIDAPGEGRQCNIR